MNTHESDTIDFITMKLRTLHRLRFGLRPADIERRLIDFNERRSQTHANQASH